MCFGDRETNEYPDKADFEINFSNPYKAVRNRL